ASDRFPRPISALMKRVTRTLSNFGSPGTSRRGTAPLRGTDLLLVYRTTWGPALQYAARRPLGRGSGVMSLGRLGPVLRPALLAPAQSARVQRPAHDVIAHPRQVLHAAAADEHDRVLLKVVPFARDVARDFDSVGEPHARHLAQRRVRLLRSGRIDTRTHAPLLRATPQRRSSGLDLLPLASMTDQLVQSRHENPPTFGRLRVCSARQATASV